MDPKQRSNRKQEEIIVAATRLFLRYTVSKTSVDDISADAHVSKVTVYKYFGDKNGLIVRVFEHTAEAFNDKVNAVISSSSPPARKMADYISLCTEFIADGQEGLCAQLAETGEAARKMYDTLLARNETAVRLLIREAKESRLIRAELDEDAIYHYINMGFCYFRHDEKYRNRMLGDSRFRESFMALVQSAIFNGFTGSSEAAKDNL